jgi:hypothetical protein
MKSMSLVVKLVNVLLREIALLFYVQNVAFMDTNMILMVANYALAENPSVKLELV